MAKKNKSGVDVRYQDKERAALVRNIRKSVFFNKHEMICINHSQTVLKAKNIILQNSTLKRKHNLASDKPSEKKKDQ